jgi:hypothetical protein
MTLKFRTYAEAWAVNERVTADCIRNNQWTDGITTNYATPTENENGQWEIPILPGYEQYFTLAEISGAQRPDWMEVTLWQLRKYLKRTKLTAFHPEEIATAIGVEVGLTAEQATSYSLFQWVKHLIALMPEDTEQQRDAKDTAEEAIEYANYIERDSVVIAALGQVMMLTDENKDFIFQEAKKM